MTPKISIIIPCYQQGEYLEDAIESALNQTTAAHEIIVINDGSTDNSREIAERYMFREFPMIQSPVKVINQVNKGLSSARNTGIMAATGDYIFPLDADDMAMENAVEVFTREVINTGADILAPSFREFGKREQDIILGMFNMEDLKTGNRLGYFSLIRRSALLECGGYSPRMRFGYEDWHLWFDLLSRDKSIGVLQEILIKYRVKEHSMIIEAMERDGELKAQIRKDFSQLFS